MPRRLGLGCTFDYGLDTIGCLPSLSHNGAAACEKPAKARGRALRGRRAIVTKCQGIYTSIMLRLSMIPSLLAPTGGAVVTGHTTDTKQVFCSIFYMRAHGP